MGGFYTSKQRRSIANNAALVYFSHLINGRMTVSVTDRVSSRILNVAFNKF